MEQNIIIYIGTWKFLTLIGAILAGTWYAAYRFAGIETKIAVMEAGISTLGGRVDHLYAGQSRVALLPKGARILEESGLKQWIDGSKVDLLGKCKAGYPMENPYDIQTAAFAFFDKLDFPSREEARLKIAAFQNGVDMGNVRRIGGIYFRDICLKEFGFEPKDLDDRSK